MERFIGWSIWYGSKDVEKELAKLLENGFNYLEISLDYPWPFDENRLSHIISKAKDLGFNNFLLLSRGEERETGKARRYILANTFEAFIGALYLDQGFERCRDFIEKHIITKLKEIIEKNLFRDSKSLFQEEAQERLGITPSYAVLKEWGPDHMKRFLVGVYLKDELIAEGEGSSKQEAEQLAAEEALQKKGWQ